MKRKWRQEKLEAIRWIRREVDRDCDPWVTINHHPSLLIDSSTNHRLHPTDLSPTAPGPNTTQPLALTFSLCSSQPPSSRLTPSASLPSPMLSIWLTLSWCTNSMRFNQEVPVYLTNASTSKIGQCAVLTRALIDQTRLLRNYRHCRVHLPTKRTNACA